MRILVVEDDDLIGAAIARALRDAAYVAGLGRRCAFGQGRFAGP